MCREQGLLSIPQQDHHPSLQRLPTRTDLRVRPQQRFLWSIYLHRWLILPRPLFLSVLFALLQQACLRLDVSVSPDAREAKHGELLIKCIWKRIRSLPTDLEDRNLVKALLETLEAFLRAMPPLEWRSRLMTNVPMGDMPFRTVKVLLQHIVGESPFPSLASVVFGTLADTIFTPVRRQVPRRTRL
jgi:hypothetical protein